jgi:hypothetical protein
MKTPGTKTLGIAKVDTAQKPSVAFSTRKSTVIKSSVARDVSQTTTRNQPETPGQSRMKDTRTPKSMVFVDHERQPTTPFESKNSLWVFPPHLQIKLTLNSVVHSRFVFGDDVSFDLLGREKKSEIKVSAPTNMFIYIKMKMPLISWTSRIPERQKLIT